MTLYQALHWAHSHGKSNPQISFFNIERQDGGDAVD